MKELATHFSLSKIAMKNWVAYQMKSKKEKCQWEFGKNKSWVRLKDPDMKKALASIL